MSYGNASWIGRKGRTSKEGAAAKQAIPREATKQLVYGNSDFLTGHNSIIRHFTSQQSKLASSTGFKAFTNPLHEHMFDRQFTVWLMPKVDPMSMAINAYAGKRLVIFQEDIAMVFGTPCSSKEVWDASLDKSEAMRNDIELLIGLDQQSRSPLANASKILRQLAGCELSIKEERVFKIAFVIWVVGLLCDSRNPGEIESTNFWPAIKNEDSISKFNWSSYVLESVFSACAAARMATRTNTYYSPPAGVVIFLQNASRPRMDLFDCRTLSKHIMAETIDLRGQTPCRVFGARKARKDSQVVHMRVQQSLPTALNKVPPADNQQKRPRAESASTPQDSKTHSPPINGNMQAMLAVKAHRARCLKILTAARKSIEDETDRLLDTFTNF